MTDTMPAPNAYATDPRAPALTAFLAQAAPSLAKPPELASSDASARRYWRITLPDHRTQIVMDAPPPGEAIAPFLQVAERLEAAGVPVPQRGAVDLHNGFLLLEDLGDCTLFQWRHGHAVRAVEEKLAEAVRWLPVIAGADTRNLPAFDAGRLNQEMDLFADWYAAQPAIRTMTAADRAQWIAWRDRISARLIEQPQVFVHRDYHSRNLMVHEHGGRLVTIDFQDAVKGPLAYDLVSLLRDSYIDWPEPLVESMQAAFWDALPPPLRAGQTLSGFRQDFAWVAVQRHLKVLGIFTRLSQRDGKHGYLKDIPLTWRHLQKALAQLPELDAFAAWLADFAPKAADE
ncbi:aminoglycoside phosphotransferase family protein [Halothiobacillus sp. DCM-1]|uniref:aminoglycoside phosphotransferase family protein n=1 Tax=Halothiobacillus sp. DCM-1 TaxID=3112558 RepID=UPI003246705B